MDMLIGMLWLALLVVMVVIEIITVGLATIWFAGGALVAFAAFLLGASLPLQIALFFVVSLVLLGVTRPVAKRYLEKNKERTNAESLIGETGIVTEEVDNVKATGAVSVRGQEWMARSADANTITAGAEAEILEIKGVKLMIRQKQAKSEERE